MASRRARLSLLKTTSLFVYLLICTPVFCAHNVCMNHIQRVESLEGIPKNLLGAIAKVESGRWNEESRSVEPWPWAVQAEGKSYYFENQQEAIDHITKLRKRGVSNIDVGCMQINIGYHGHQFRSVAHMINPAVNVHYAAKFLRQLKSGAATWATAVGNYHSATENHHAHYKNLVYKNLKGIEVGEDRCSHIRNFASKRVTIKPYTFGDTTIRVTTAALRPYERHYGTGIRRPLHKGKRIIIPSVK